MLRCLCSKFRESYMPSAILIRVQKTAKRYFCVHSVVDLIQSSEILKNVTSSTIIMLKYLESAP